MQNFRIVIQIWNLIGSWPDNYRLGNKMYGPSPRALEQYQDSTK